MCHSKLFLVILFVVQNQFFVYTSSRVYLYQKVIVIVDLVTLCCAAGWTRKDEGWVQVWNLQWWKIIIHPTSQQILHKKFSSVQNCDCKPMLETEETSIGFNINFSDIQQCPGTFDIMHSYLYTTTAVKFNIFKAYTKLHCTWSHSMQPCNQLWKSLKDLQFTRTLKCMYMAFMLQPNTIQVNEQLQY